MGYIVELKTTGDCFELVPDAQQVDVTPTGHLILKRRSDKHVGGYENLAIFEPDQWRAVYKDEAVQGVHGMNVYDPHSIERLKNLGKS